MTRQTGIESKWTRRLWAFCPLYFLLSFPRLSNQHLPEHCDVRCRDLKQNASRAHFPQWAPGRASITPPVFSRTNDGAEGRNRRKSIKTRVAAQADRRNVIRIPSWQSQYQPRSFKFKNHSTISIFPRVTFVPAPIFMVLTSIQRHTFGKKGVVAQKSDTLHFPEIKAGVSSASYFSIRWEPPDRVKL